MASMRVFAWVAVLCVGSASTWAAQMRVAVMEFSNASKDADLEPLGKGLQSMVTTDLSVVKAVSVIERERLKAVRQELALARSSGFDKKSVASMGKLLGATHLFVGSFTVLGEAMRLDGRLIEIGTGQVLLAEQMSGEKALFFELEQQLVQKVIASLGAKLAPKEKAQLARAHTADFEAFRQYSQGLQAFDDGRLEDALKALNTATELDKDFQLATLTLEEYERLAAQVRAKAEAAGRVENELEKLEKNKAISAEVTVIKKLWALLDATKGNSSADKVRRVAAACALSSHYASKLGFQNRGPVNAEDLAAAGFDDFSLQRTADALFKRAWAEAPDVFPQVTPLCIRLDALSSSNPRSVEELLQFEIDDARKLFAQNEVILSYMANSSTVDAAAERLHLDPPGVVQLWEKLYALAQKLPGLSDEARAGFEKDIAERRRRAGDFDGSTQMFAAASRHTKDSYQLKQYAEEIEKNKSLKRLVGTERSPLREYFLLRPTTHVSELDRLAPPDAKERLTKSLESAREVSQREFLLFNGVPTWFLKGPTFGSWLHSGARTSQLAAQELHYRGEARDGNDSPAEPLVLATSLRGRRPTVKATLSGDALAGIAFAVRRVSPEGGIERGAPLLTVAHAVLVGGTTARLVRLTRDGEHRLAVHELARATVPEHRGPVALEVKVEADKVQVSVGTQRVSWPWKVAEGEADGYVGWVFHGSGVATLGHPVIESGR